MALDATNRRGGAHARRSHRARIDVRGQRKHRRLDRVDQSAGEREHHKNRQRPAATHRFASCSSVIAPTAAPAVIASIGKREPKPPIATLPASAPTTPPRLNAVMPMLAVAGSKPALVRSAGQPAEARDRPPVGRRRSAPNNASVSDAQIAFEQRLERRAADRLFTAVGEGRAFQALGGPCGRACAASSGQRRG